MSAKSPLPMAVSLFALMLVVSSLLSEPSNARQDSAIPVEQRNIENGKTGKQSSQADETPKELHSGKVVFLQEALKRRSVKSADEFKGQVVLETDDGELIPIVPDWRGRAFYQDERLRDRKVDLVGSRQKAAPYLQVQMVFVFDEQGTRQYMDYWCDICSIAMYEIKPCDCCQEKIRLRLQPQELPEFVKPKTATKSRPN